MTDSGYPNLGFPLVLMLHACDLIVPMEVANMGFSLFCGRSTADPSCLELYANLLAELSSIVDVSLYWIDLKISFADTFLRVDLWMIHNVIYLLIG
eukprot:CAMPEP_0167764850 /NCGR_PEP_ID=MMETSP0110_2-20121227/14302_1 /TAXON_ID=629695 /ORGANISM="Gymnochlora sp., Strain CCMP2014" /LENGTH=95 /DNA_ID=CAMNT_0007652381 /DNA_START=317 /DNA_END=600 /DNA_ORIENTATION=+